MKLWKQVQHIWQALSRRERRTLRSFAKGSPDAVLRVRCKVVIALVQGNGPRKIQETKLASESQVYRVIERFLADRLAGLVDRREDNGDSQIGWYYESQLCEVVAGSPQDYGYRRPTWTHGFPGSGVECSQRGCWHRDSQEQHRTIPNRGKEGQASPGCPRNGRRGGTRPGPPASDGSADSNSSCPAGRRRRVTMAMEDQHDHGHHHGSPCRKLHHDWRLWLVVGRRRTDRQRQASRRRQD
jgi:hypothetical protein